MPSQIKVDEIKNVAGQYKIKTNVFEGQTTAGSITVQGEGAATTNLQQGLIKAWCDVTVASNEFGDSFNMASITDHGSSDHEYFYTNDFANSEYAAGHMCGDTGNTTGADLTYKAAPTAGSSRLRTTYNSNTAYEWAHQKHMYIGDLA